ncbi:hypothetical protein EDC65_1595 [Stella humosa]|uniref:Uncharacterized protein n=1 Tax=Stella humosa TaxID=94 RepID=A0A3N1MAS7_9PROT|nr:hypothetical protein [Stella humosa]ROP99806.1 hypothetical protein EDC65_1595 [Stella humosa]BBK30966.1 hypothetical protein STHU_16000 [Stella humosa]
MTSEEFERLQRRFGQDHAAWPAPYRQEAAMLLGGRAGAGAGTGDAALDRQVLEAAAAPTDERAFLAGVLARTGRARQRPAFIPGLWPRPAAVGTAMLSAVLLLSAVGGYWAGGGEDEIADEVLLALAVGAPGEGQAGIWPRDSGIGGRP